MTHNELRQEFLKFFKSKGHTIVPSDLLVPAGDATLLFTSAGMNQFKEQFLGKIKGFRRAASCQRCLRTPDLEKVGKTVYHHTFFEMLGNFSFGDYFKEEAILWAWEFMKDILRIPDTKMWVSVYTDDDEAYRAWKNIIKLPKDRIVKLGQKENFWPSEAKDKGPNGPCGPCSEIFYDYGEDVGCGKKDCSPACDCERFVEVWNLVFTQFNRRDGGVLEPLPGKNIDTGMGLERLCAVMQGVMSNFETDLFAPIIKAIREELPKEHTAPACRRRRASVQDTANINAISDHIRAATFAICDGVVPSNEERGYVIRNLIRKSTLHAKRVGIDRPFLYRLVYAVAKVMQDAYPELIKCHQDISQVIKAEEERFASTLKDGQRLLDETIAKIKKSNKRDIPGDIAFKLFDTHGLPLLIVREIATKEGLGVDEKEFNRLMQAQRRQSRDMSKMQESIFVDSGISDRTEFIGYNRYRSKAKVLRILTADTKEIESADRSAGRVKIILDKSVFYGEAGGQVGDSGRIESKGLEVKISNAKKVQDAIVLEGDVIEGKIRKGERVDTAIDEKRRLAIAKNHTATHLLQHALRRVLGEHVRQQGSFVGDAYLRFDFTHFKALTKDELDRIEGIVNQHIRDKSLVKKKTMSLKKARESGALAFFGEKYEQDVMVVSAGDYSHELCGGTHLDNTSDIGLFKILNESSIASGIRRIEAVTGDCAYKKLKEQEALLLSVAEILKCKPEQIEERIEKLTLQLDRLNRRLRLLLSKKMEESIDDIIDKGKDISGVKLIIAKLEYADVDVLRQTADKIKTRVKSFAAFLVSIAEAKANLLLSISDDMVKKGTDASKLISAIAKHAGGSGGGRPHMALGGAKNLDKIDYMIKEAKDILSKEINT